MLNKDTKCGMIYRIVMSRKSRAHEKQAKTNGRVRRGKFRVVEREYDSRGRTQVKALLLMLNNHFI